VDGSIILKFTLGIDMNHKEGVCHIPAACAVGWTWNTQTRTVTSPVDVAPSAVEQLLISSVCGGWLI
jgi:hypothetical protein